MLQSAAATSDTLFELRALLDIYSVPYDKRAGLLVDCTSVAKLENKICFELGRRNLDVAKILSGVDPRRNEANYWRCKIEFVQGKIVVEYMCPEVQSSCIMMDRFGANRTLKAVIKYDSSAYPQAGPNSPKLKSGKKPVGHEQEAGRKVGRDKVKCRGCNRNMPIGEYAPYWKPYSAADSTYERYWCNNCFADKNGDNDPLVILSREGVLFGGRRFKFVFGEPNKSAKRRQQQLQQELQHHQRPQQRQMQQQPLLESDYNTINSVFFATHEEEEEKEGPPSLVDQPTTAEPVPSQGLVPVALDTCRSFLADFSAFSQKYGPDVWLHKLNARLKLGYSPALGCIPISNQQVLVVDDVYSPSHPGMVMTDGCGLISASLARLVPMWVTSGGFDLSQQPTAHRQFMHSQSQNQSQSQSQSSSQHTQTIGQPGEAEEAAFRRPRFPVRPPNALLPSVIQFRMSAAQGLFKGLLLVTHDTTLCPHDCIVVRPSMKKAEGPVNAPSDTTCFVQNTFEPSPTLSARRSVDYGSPSTYYANTSRPLVLLLEALGVDKEVFLLGVERELERIQLASLDRGAAYKLAKSLMRAPPSHDLLASSGSTTAMVVDSPSSSPPSPSHASSSPRSQGSGEPLYRSSEAEATMLAAREVLDMLRCGFALSEPFLFQRLLLLQKAQLKGLGECRLRIADAHYFVGVPDPTGTLLDNEVYVALHTYGGVSTQPGGAAGRAGAVSPCVRGRVLVTRNPMSHCGDIRVLEAVTSPALEAYLRGTAGGVCVFSTRGPRAQADKMGGGDYDGDEFLVIWGQAAIVTDVVEYPPYTAPEAQQPPPPPQQPQQPQQPQARAPAPATATVTATATATAMILSRPEGAAGGQSLSPKRSRAVLSDDASPAPVSASAPALSRSPATAATTAATAAGAAAGSHLLEATNTNRLTPHSVAAGDSDVSDAASSGSFSGVLAQAQAQDSQGIPMIAYEASTQELCGGGQDDQQPVVGAKKEMEKMDCGAKLGRVRRVGRDSQGIALDVYDMSTQELLCADDDEVEMEPEAEAEAESAGSGAGPGPGSVGVSAAQSERDRGGRGGSAVNGRDESSHSSHLDGMLGARGFGEQREQRAVGGGEGKGGVEGEGEEEGEGGGGCSVLKRPRAGEAAGGASCSQPDSTQATQVRLSGESPSRSGAIGAIGGRIQWGGFSQLDVSLGLGASQPYDYDQSMAANVLALELPPPMAAGISPSPPRLTPPQQPQPQPQLQSSSSSSSSSSHANQPAIVTPTAPKDTLSSQLLLSLVHLCRHVNIGSAANTWLFLADEYGPKSALAMAADEVCRQQLDATKNGLGTLLAKLRELKDKAVKPHYQTDKTSLNSDGRAVFIPPIIDGTSCRRSTSICGLIFDRVQGAERDLDDLYAESRIENDREDEFNHPLGADQDKPEPEPGTFRSSMVDEQMLKVYDGNVPGNKAAPSLDLLQVLESGGAGGAGGAGNAGGVSCRLSAAKEPVKLSIKKWQARMKQYNTDMGRILDSSNKLSQQEKKEDIDRLKAKMVAKFDDEAAELVAKPWLPELGGSKLIARKALATVVYYAVYNRHPAKVKSCRKQPDFAWLVCGAELRRIKKESVLVQFGEHLLKDVPRSEERFV